MQPGIYDSLTNAEYHGGPGVNKGLLDLVHRSPMHAKYALDMREQGTNDNEATAAQFIGTAFHALLLEPESFVKNYTLALRRQDVPHAIEDREVLVGMVQELNATRLPKLATSGSKAEQVARILEAEADLPEALRATAAELEALKGADLKARIEELNKDRAGLLSVPGTRHELADILRANGKDVTLWSDVMAEWTQNNGHFQVLTAEQWEQLHAMRNAVMDHPAASALLTRKPGRAEMSVYWTDPVTGLLCRCRPDFWRQDGILVDVKTTEDASPEEFGRSIAKWRYHVQAPYYLDGTNQAFKAGHLPQDWEAPRAFAFLVVEKKPPHAVAVYVLDQESHELGRIEYRKDLDTLADCQKTGLWPAFGTNIQKISLPAWYVRQNMPEAA